MSTANTLKQAKSLARIEAAKNRRAKKTYRFYQRLVERRGLVLESTGCAIGSPHLVERVWKVGNGYVYTVAVCGGCQQGRSYLDLNVPSSGKVDLTNVPPFPKMCPEIQNTTVYFSAQPIEPGDVLTTTKSMLAQLIKTTE